MRYPRHSGIVPACDDGIAGDFGRRVPKILNRACFARDDNMCTVVDHGPAHCAVQDGYPAPPSTIKLPRTFP